MCRRKFVWSPSSSIERVTITVAARIRSLPFREDLCARARSAPMSLSRALIRFREFSSTRAEARPSMSRNLDASAAGIARTSSWEWLWTRARVRDRTERARVREGRKGSDVLEDGPADGGSSKPKESGCGADVERGSGRQNSAFWCERVLLERRTHHNEAPTMQPSTPPSPRRPIGSSAIECERQERTLDLSTVLKALHGLH